MNTAGLFKKFIHLLLYSDYIIENYGDFVEYTSQLEDVMQDYGIDIDEAVVIGSGALATHLAKAERPTPFENR